MTAYSDESEIWKNICSGDINAFNILFKAYYKPLYTAAFLVVKDEEASEDIVQDVFFKIWSRKQELKHVASIGAYLYISVKNACYDYIRKKKQAEDISGIDVNDSSADPYNHVRIKELGKYLRQASDSLPPQCKEIFEMVYVDGKKYQFVADELGISINTVKTQLKRALAKMRKIMQEYK